MRLHEFDINIERDVLSLDKTDPKKFAADLENLGFKSVGSGYFAEVFSLDQGNRVIKVAMRSDPAYEKFLKIALNNTSNPHLPKVYWKVPFKFHNLSSGFITALEKLESIRDLLSDPNSFNTVYKKLGNDALILLHATNTIEGVRAFPSFNILTFEKEGWLDEINKNKDQIESSKLYVTLKKMDNLGTRIGVSQIDIHRSNIMLRQKTNTVVITDPWAF